MKPDDVRDVQPLVVRVALILHGHPPHIQGAVLADLFAMWLASHVDTEGRTAKLREVLIKDWLAKALELVPENEKAILERTKRPSN
jgi:hypothetical protein